jgi:pimeloyl-ACP methyl ester carboxylesterase
MPQFRVRDRTWNLDESGGGEPPIVLLHAWGADLASMSEMAASFGRAHRVWSVDLPGHGATTAGADLSVEGVAADLAVLLFRLGVRAPILVGHDLGAAVAVELARNLQHFLTALVLIAPAPIAPDAAARRRMEAFARALQSDDRETALASHAERWLFAPGDDPARRARLEAGLRALPPEVAAATVAELLDWDGESAARACVVPVLLVESAKPKNDPAALRKLFGRLETATFPDVGHFVHLERPDEVHAAIAGFLRRLGARGQADALTPEPSAPPPVAPPAAPAPALPDDLVEFIGSGLSIMVGTRDAQHMPEATRCVGVRVHDDRRHVTVYVAAATADQTVANVRDNGQVAVSLSRPADHRSLQIKGTAVAVREAGPADEAEVDRYIELAVPIFEFIGIGPQIIRRVAHWPAWAIDVAIGDAFVQTPGPGAGHRLQS